MWSIMRSIQIVKNNKILLSCLSVYIAFSCAISSTEGAMLRFGLTIPKIACDAYSKCDNDSLCINHLNITTGCYEKLCVPQENLTNVTCDTLNCHRNYECRRCSAESLNCGALNFECALEKHRNCSSLKCDDDYQCRQQKPIPGKGATCRTRLASNTYVCKREVHPQHHQRKEGVFTP